MADLFASKLPSNHRTTEENIFSQQRKMSSEESHMILISEEITSF